MASDNHVVIKIDVRADTKAIGRVRRELAALAAEAEAIDKKFGRMGDRLTETASKLDDLGDSSERTDKKLDDMSKSVDRNGKSLRRNHKDLRQSTSLLGKFAGGLQKIMKFGFKALALSSAGLGVALMAVNAAFRTGPYIMRAYQATVTGLFTAMAVGAATVVTALSTVAAAQREMIAATNSNRYGGGQQGVFYAAAGMKVLTAQTELAIFGAEDLNSTFASISKSGKMTAQVGAALASMGDFAAAAGVGLADFGSFTASLIESGKLTKDLVKEAGKISPEFGAAVKKAQELGLTTSDEVLKAFTSGALSEEVEGSLETVNRTLIGTLKRNFGMMKEQFADFGTQFLPSFTLAFDEIGRIFQRTMWEMSGPITAFFNQDTTDGIVGGIDKMARGLSSIVTEYLPRAKSVFNEIKTTLIGWGQGIAAFVDKLRPLSEGGRVLNDMFAPIVDTLVNGIGNGLTSLSESLQNNRERFTDFGEAVAKLLGHIINVGNVMRQAFLSLLPVLTKVTQVVSMIVGLISKLLGGIAGLPGGGPMLALGALGAYVGLGRLSKHKTGSKGSGLGRVRGAAGRGGGDTPGGGPGGVERLGAVNMTATTVHLTGALSKGVSKRIGKDVSTAATNATTAAVRNSGLNVGQGGEGGSRSYRAGYKVGQMGQIAKNGAITAGGFMRDNAGLIAGLAMPFIGSYLDDASALTMNGGKIQGGYRTAGNLGAMYMMANHFGATDALGKFGMGGMKGLAPVAAGAIAGGYASSAALNNSWGAGLGGKTHGAVGIGAGLGAGAAAGAGVGALLTAWTGPGAAVGAAVGAILGGIAGGVAGYVNSRKYKGQAKDLAEDYVGAYDDAITDRLEKGDVRGAEKLMLEMDQSATKLGEASPHVDSFNEKFDEMSTQLSRKASPAITAYNRNVKAMASMTGLSTAKIEDLATAAGVNLTGSLSDAIKKIDEVTGVISILNKTQRLQVQGQAVTEIVSQALRRPIEAQEARAAIDEQGVNMQELGNSGMFAAMTPEKQLATMAEYLQTGYQYNMTVDNDPFKAMMGLDRMMGEGGAMYNIGDRLEGLGDLYEPIVTQLLDSMLVDFAETDVITGQMVGLNRNLAGSAIQFNPAQEEQRIQNLISAGKMDEAREIIRKINELTDASSIPAASGAAKDALLAALSQAGFTSVSTTLTPATDAWAEITTGMSAWLTSNENSAAVMQSAATIQQAAANTPIKIDLTAPEPFKWNVPEPPKDTTTPWANAIGDTTGSRLNRTMSRHHLLDSRLTGKRKVTSSWRDSNLGSINSDHVTGNAYDLTGQNLGAYQQMVAREGGFSEFHGRGGSRHLHVVPGQGPSGDSSTPVGSNAGTTTAPAMVSGDSFSFVINSSSANPNEIAAAVMDKIDRRDRSRRERA